jgi:hypothetical protein
MSNLNTYSKVLGLYKRLYITRNQIFQGDNQTLSKSLTRLRDEFRANLNETDSNKIEKLIKEGKEVDRLLRTSVLQTVKTDKPNVYRLKVKPYMIQDNHISK